MILGLALWRQTLREKKKGCVCVYREELYGDVCEEVGKTALDRQRC